MKYFVASFFVFGLFLKCKSDAVSEDLSSQENSGKRLEIKYLALGDSYTIGTAIGKENSYASLLVAKIKSNENADLDLKIIAKNGWTTGDLKKGISQENVEPVYDLVSLLIGVNNQYQAKPLSQYRHQFRDLCLEAIALAKNDASKVFVLSIPDYGATPGGKSNRKKIAVEIDRFNKVNEEICDSLNIKRFDITEISRTAAGNSEMVASDNLHFSKKMHEKWVEATYQEVLSIAVE